MDIATKLECLEKEVERLRRWQRRAMVSFAAVAVGAGVLFGLLGNRDVNAEDSKGLSGSSITLTGASDNAAVRIAASKPTAEQKGMEGIDFIDSTGGLRARIYWGHGPSRTTFALYNGKGQVIQALPID